MTHKKLRLVKLVLQPTFVLDDGTTLVEMVNEPIAVSAADWPTFPETFAQAIEASEQRLNQDPQDVEGATGVC